MAMAHELAGFGPRTTQPKAVHDVVEPRFKKLHQIVAGDPGSPRGLDKVFFKLTLEHAVVAANFLLLPELRAVLRLLPSPRVRRRGPGWLGAALESAFRDALLPLEEELYAFAPAQSANRAGIPC